MTILQTLCIVARARGRTTKFFVAQICHVLYRRIAFGMAQVFQDRWRCATACGLQIRDSAGCNPALRSEDSCPAPRPGKSPGASSTLTPIAISLALLVSGLLPALSATAPQVVRTTLSNGLRVIVVADSLAPVVTTVMNYKVGSNEAPKGFPGTAHALEHMMFRGSPGLSADQLAEVTAALGGNFNADTQQGVTQYFFTTPAKDLDMALHVESLRMRGLAKDKELWNKERGAIEQEVAQDLSNPEYVFYTKLLRVMFRGTPYEHDALGTRPSFNETTSAMLRKFHSEWYTPSNAVLIISGNVQPQEAIDTIHQLFAPIPSHALPPRPDFNFEPVKPTTLNLNTDLPYGMTVVAFRFPGSDSPDYAAAQILADVLSSQRGNLYGLVPAGKALFAEFDYEGLAKAGLGFAAAGFPAGGQSTNLLREVEAILSGHATNGVSSDLVEAAKRREIASAEFQKNSVFGLAMEWSDAVAVEGRNSPQDDINAIRKVTLADVDRVAKKYLSMGHAVNAILTPQASGKAISSKSFGGQEALAPTPTKAVKLPAWAQSAMKRLDIPSPTVHPVVTNLANGIKLIIQPEAVSDTVCVYGRIQNKANVEMPNGQDGVDQALDQLFSYGTTTLGRLAFQKALDDIAATESAGTSFSLAVLTNHFDRGVELLAQNELSPALPERAFKILQPQLAAAVAGQLRSPSYRFSRALAGALFPTNDPAQRAATPGTVKSLSIQDIRHYYEYAFRPDLTTIVVIGNVTPAHATAVLSKYFGDWKASGPKPDTLYPPAPANHPATVEVPDTSRVQDNVVLAQTLGLTRTNNDYYALDLGNHVLGGAFYATRLYRDLRKEAGLVYYVSSSFQVGLTRGVYSVNYACDPPNVSKARAIIVRDLKQMCDQDVGHDELHQAKVLLLRKVPLSEASFGEIAGGWLSRSELGLPLDEPVRAARRYVKLDAAAVRKAFARWLRPQDLAQVTLGPAPK